MRTIETTVTENCEADDGAVLTFSIKDRENKVVVRIVNDNSLVARITLDYYILSRAIGDLDLHKEILYNAKK